MTTTKERRPPPTDKAMSETFDRLSDGIKQPVERKPLRHKQRRRGRPAKGRVVFEQARIDHLPELAHSSEVARVLDIRHTSLQQWCDKPVDALPFVTRAGHKWFRKDVLVKWLIATKRLKAKA